VSRFIYEGKLKDAIHQYKFEDAYLLSEDFSLALSPIIKGVDGYNKYALTYIPLVKRRQRYRGYNQSKILAERLADRLKMTSVDLLERKEQRETQVFAKTKSARRKNVKGVFVVKGGAKIPKKIILIDDVVTTGATVEEATKVLKKAGAREIIVVALAMGR
jgi:competence protein ComFC